MNVKRIFVVLCFIAAPFFALAQTPPQGPTRLGASVNLFNGFQFAVSQSGLGSPGGTMSGYAAGDTITLQCTGITFSTAPVIGVVTVTSGAVTTHTVSNPGLTSGNVPSGTASCSQASTSGAGAGYTTTAILGLIDASGSGFVGNNAAGNLLLNSSPSDTPPVVTGGENTYVGVHAGYGLLGNAQYSTALGLNACGVGGSGVTSGSGNAMVCIGTDAARNIQGSGVYQDVFIGEGAARNAGTNTAGNVIIGFQAAGSGGNNSAGSFSSAGSTIMGAGTGGALTNGSYNLTLIGNGVASTTLTNGNHDVIIGDSSACDAPGTTTTNMLKLCAGGAGLLTVTGGNVPSTSIAAFAGALTTNSTFQTVTAYSAAGTALPTCNSGAKGTRAFVTDATSPSYLGTYTSGGAAFAPVICNGTNWLTSANDNMIASSRKTA